MRILVTCPGKFGDLLWSMSVARAIADTYGERVDILTSQQYESLCPLLEQQVYIENADADVLWKVQDTAPMTPRTPVGRVGGYDRVFHLGYDGWPQHPLPLEHWRLAVKQREWFVSDPPLKDVELGRAWITVPDQKPYTVTGEITVGFTDEHFELKAGILHLLRKDQPYNCRWVGNSPRWYHEMDQPQWDWVHAAATIKRRAVFLGCCSALHVLAVAVGTPAVLMEPNPHRHNAMFYPLGKVGPQVTLVTGNDGLPTFDARHVADAVESALTKEVLS